MELSGEKRNTIIGRIDASDIMHGKDWVMLTYENGDPYRGHCKGNGSEPGEKRRAKIMFVCDEGASDVKARQPRVVEEMTNTTMGCYYLFEINTIVVCQTRPLRTIGLSTGTILIIVFVCVATFCLLAGVIYKRVMLKAKGLEQTRNIDFWKNFGNLEAMLTQTKKI
ncbi:cation-dependent mannose-6-phosphate receptor-like isoform X2 [Dreissena polymorpha]|nr:cation-dependent mannose-6-phosphate receptor-like isoform X2 [Dreissena polymorpha]